MVLRLASQVSEPGAQPVEGPAFPVLLGLRPAHVAAVLDLVDVDVTPAAFLRELIPNAIFG